MRLTWSDVLEVTGLTSKEFRLWCEHGIIAPTEGGKGRGQHRQFSFSQVVALTSGRWWKESGAGLKLIKEIVSCIAAFEEEALEREIAAGRRFVLVVPGQSRLVEPPPGVKVPEILDLKFAFNDVKRKITQVKSHLKNKIHGRSRGLTGPRKTKCNKSKKN